MKVTLIPVKIAKVYQCQKCRKDFKHRQSFHRHTKKNSCEPTATNGLTQSMSEVDQQQPSRPTSDNLLPTLPQIEESILEQTDGDEVFQELLQAIMNDNGPEVSQNQQMAREITSTPCPCAFIGKVVFEGQEMQDLVIKIENGTLTVSSQKGTVRISE